MNSEEALKRIKKSHRIAMACLGIDKPDIETEKAIEKIEKDLEVLEILKNSLELEEEDDCISFKFKFCCDKESLNDDYEIRTIKEWLENEKANTHLLHQQD